MTTPVVTGGPSAATRETAYRIVSAVVTLLFGIGVINASQDTLWAQLAVGAVTLVFAIFYSTSSWRTALYAILGPVAAVLGAYGLLQNVDWAVITAAVAQALGVTTAAAKAVQLPTTV